MAKTTGGDCYRANGNEFFNSFGGPNVFLVHGEVVGQGPLEGVHYGHCWIEDGEDVIDVSNGRNIRIPKDLYYTIGRIGKNVHRYTMDEARERVMKFKHWGPWDLRVSSES
jgi:hypothetical protein